MLNERDRAILDIFTRKLRELFPLARIYVYGSRARGDYSEESDLDICVVLDDLDLKIRSAISHIAWEVGLENDRLVTTVAFTTDAFDRFPGAANPLVQNIMEEGIAA